MTPSRYVFTLTLSFNQSVSRLHVILSLVIKKKMAVLGTFEYLSLQSFLIFVVLALVCGILLVS